MSRNVQFKFINTRNIYKYFKASAAAALQVFNNLKSGRQKPQVHLHIPDYEEPVIGFILQQSAWLPLASGWATPAGQLDHKGLVHNKYNFFTFDSSPSFALRILTKL